MVEQLDGQTGKFSIKPWDLVVDLTIAKTIRLTFESGTVELAMKL